MPGRHHTRGGFTIVELLVVIGIIALLVSILMPALSRARRQGQSIKCKNNVRQIHAACTFFANENKQWLPRGAKIADASGSLSAATLAADEQTFAWLMQGDGSSALSCGRADFTHGALWKYLGTGDAAREVIQCPSDQGDDPMRRGSVITPATPRNFAFSFNGRIDDYNGTTRDARGMLWGVKTTRIIKPSEKIMIVEELAPNDAYGTGVWGANTDDRPSGRHGAQRRSASGTVEDTSGSGNYGFFDGHVEEIPISGIIGHRELFDPIAVK